MNGKLLFGRNYDWVTGNGIVVVNARGIEKTSFVSPGEKPVHWVSVNGSITFNQFGKEFPHGGMNDAGLVVELMWLQGTVYPGNDERPVLNELQWIQYQLDNFSTVDEVVNSNKTIRIGREGAAPLHYLVADASGHAATIEFINGKMVVHQGANLPYPVLTNTIYSVALQATTKPGKKPGYADHSIERFATACSMVKQFQESKVTGDARDYAFSILNKIALPGYTKWRIVYDITNREILFVTTGKRKTLNLTDFDFSCKGNGLYLNLYSTQTGNVKPYFTPLSFTENRRLLLQSARESRSQILIPDKSSSGAAAYFQEVQCR
jgi:choloylglycine hydrolase